jgi:hypothetical protein
MSHKEEMVAGTDELADAVQVVTETFPDVKAGDSAPRLGVVSLADLERPNL